MIKRMLLFLTLIVCLASCGNNSKVTDSNTVQRDTIKANSKTTIITSDTVIKTGEYIKYYKNGIVQMRGMMKDGKREGIWKSWYENGSPWSETTFSNGIKNGRTTTWYENEQKRYDGFYANDSESGKWIYYDEKGKIVERKDYDKK